MWDTRSRQACGLVLGAVVAAGLVAVQRAGAAPPAPIYQATALTKEAFQRLPDGAVIEARGKRFTAGELRAQARRNAEAFRAGMGPLTGPSRPGTDVLQTLVLPTRKAKLDAENARIRATFKSRNAVRPAGAGLVVATKPTVPTITEIVGTVQSGAALYIKGMNFGYDGDVVLRGLPQGVVTLALDTGNYLMPWLPDGIAVVVPEVTGIDDRPASIQVNVRNGLGSKEKPVTFYATDVIVSNVDVALLGCSQDATENRCDNTHGSYFGLHTENTLVEADALGCDHWAFTLNNGWTVESSSSFAGGVMGEAGSTFHPQQGATHFEWQICWSVRGGGPYSGNFVRYGGALNIRGHLGVPW